MRKQQESESLLEYLSALRALATTANFGADTEVAIRRQFTVGAASAEIQERLVLDAALPFRVALQTVLNLERSCREVREWTTATVPTGPSAATEEHVTSHVTERTPSQPPPRTSSVHETWRSRRESPARSPTPRSSARSWNARASHSPSQQSCVTCGRSGDGGFDRGSGQQIPGRSSFRRSVRFESPRRQPSPRRSYGYGRTCPNCGYGQDRCSGYDVCPARGQYCDYCGRREHFSRACRSVRRSLLRRPRDQVEEIVDDYYDDDDEQWEVCHISGPPQSKMYLSIQVFESTLKFLLDTGSAVSIVDSALFVRYFASKAIVVPPPVTLLNFSRQPIVMLGAFEAPVMFRERSATVLFYIADRGTPLLGMDAVVALDIQMSGATRSCFYTDTEGSGDLPREEDERSTPAPQDEASSALSNEWSARMQNQPASPSSPPHAAASVVPEPVKQNLPPSMITSSTSSIRVLAVSRMLSTR